MKKETLKKAKLEKIKNYFNKYCGQLNDSIFRFDDEVTRFIEQGKLYVDSRYSDITTIYGRLKKERLSIEYFENGTVSVELVDKEYNLVKKLKYSYDALNNVSLTAKVSVRNKDEFPSYEKNGEVKFDSEGRFISEEIREHTELAIEHTGIYNIEDKKLIKKKLKTCFNDPSNVIKEFGACNIDPAGLMDKRKIINKMYVGYCSISENEFQNLLRQEYNAKIYKKR